MSSNKQSSVEWLVEQLLIYGDKAFNKEITLGEYHIKKQELIEQAKEMHKEEIINAVDGFPLSNRNLEGAEYYTKTYGKKTFIDLVSDEESKVHEVVRQLKEKKDKI